MLYMITISKYKEWMKSMSGNISQHPGMDYFPEFFIIEVNKAK